MADVNESKPGGSPVLLSVRRLSRELSMARETISKRLDQAGVLPSDERNGHPVFRLRDALPALLTRYTAADGSAIDPADLKPVDRRAWFQSENERLKFEDEQGHLLPALEVRSEVAQLASVLDSTLNKLAHDLKRDAGVPPSVVEYVRQKIEAARAQISAAAST